MGKKVTEKSRRKFLKGAGAVGVAGFAGCTGDDENDAPDEAGNSTPTGTDTPESGTETGTKTESTPENRVTFAELYSEAARKPIVGETLSQNTGRFDLDEVEDMLSPDNSEAENVAIAATQASQHTRRREDTPETIRYALDELELNAFAQKRATLGAIKTDVYVVESNRAKKVAVTKVPHNTDIPLQYSLIGGKEPGTGDGAKADNNLAKDWKEEQVSGVSYLDYRAIEYAKDSERVSSIEWDGVANQVKRSYLIDMGVEGSDIDFTAEAGQYMADLEDIDNADHTEAFEAYVEANEFYHSEVVPEDQHLLVELDNGELQPTAVDEATLMERGYLHSHI